MNPPQAKFFLAHPKQDFGHLKENHYVACACNSGVYLSLFIIALLEGPIQILVSSFNVDFHRCFRFSYSEWREEPYLIVVSVLSDMGSRANISRYLKVLMPVQNLTGFAIQTKPLNTTNPYEEVNAFLL